LTLLVILSACKGPTSVSAPTMTLPSPTATQTLPTSTPTEILKPTEVTPVLVIDVTKPSSEWDLSSLSADQQAAIKNWLANPSGATEKEKQIADDFLTKQWQLTLETEATGAQLYDQIANYIQSHGGEAGLLPNSVHKGVRTDKSNVMLYGPAKGMDPLTKFSYYGFGVDVQNANLVVDTDAQLIPSINFYGDSIVRKDNVYPVTNNLPLMGDIIGLFELPGIDKSMAQGAVVRLIDKDGNVGYVEVQIQYTNTLQTSNLDTCLSRTGNQLVGGACQEGIAIPQTLIATYTNQGNLISTSHDQLISLINRSNDALHVTIFGGMGGKGAPGEFGVWQNGQLVVKSLVVFSNNSIQ